MRSLLRSLFLAMIFETLAMPLTALAGDREAAADEPQTGAVQRASPPEPVAGTSLRKQIGTSLGEPVYQDEIQTGQGITLASELHRLFSGPAAQKYREKHKSELEPTEEEIEHAAAVFDRRHRERIKDRDAESRERLRMIEERLKEPQSSEARRKDLQREQQTLSSDLEPPGRTFATFLLRQYKFQRHLYDRYGGGRVLWQQAGLEAFDANRKWLEDLESRGKFTITDPELRRVFYQYWNSSHGVFMIEDPERIRKEFLEPDWVMPRPAAERR